MLAEPTKFGNPFKIGKEVWYERYGHVGDYFTADDHLQAVQFYVDNECWEGLPISDLRGKDLACWCPLEDAHGRAVPRRHTGGASQQRCRSIPHVGEHH